METIQRNVGRVLEVVFPVKPTVEWIKLFASEVQIIMTGIHAEGVRAATFADLSKSRIMSAEASHLLVQMLKADNPLIQRTTVVIGDDPLLDMQIWRVLSDADSPNRKSFTDPAEARDWLLEIIDDADEERRVRELHDLWFPG